MNGLVDDEQTEEKLQQDKAGETQETAQTATQASVTKPVEQREQADDGEANAAAVAAAAPSQSKPDPAGSTNVAGAQEQQVARKIARRAETEEDRIRAYIRQLSKRIHARLDYPEEGRRAGLRGVAKVSFGILASGQIRSSKRSRSFRRAVRSISTSAR